PFSDIGMHTYRHSIQALWERNVISGYGNHTFGPDNKITRAELLKIVLEASSAPVGNQTGCFVDIKDEWFAKYVCYAHTKGIINGYADNTFKPNQHITISESFKIGLKGFGIYVSDSSNKERYTPYFDFVHNNNIISKYAITHDMHMKRGMMSHLIYQLLLNKERKLTFNNQRSVISSGCGEDAPTITPSFSYVDGVKRSYITAIGKHYDKNNPTPLIIAFHGRTNSNEMVRSYYGIEKAAEGNAIIVYPSGLPQEGPSRNRSNPGDKSNQLRDFALFDQLVQEFSQKYCINKDKIFVVGHSLGAWFTNSLACARGDVIRAIGSVGGGTTINTCNGPVAAMIMHNPEDNLASYQSALTARNQLLKQNSCGPETVEFGPAGSNCVQYTNCQTDAPVIRCPHSQSTDHRGNYYPHVRPSFAGQEIRNFFMAQK
ncbi:MAG: S-layer homology domain-containing protein, partial [Candidatus Absconditabacterales bacterium]